MQIVILAGGLGTRLSEETVVKPKPMVEIGGKPIVWHIMNYYSSFGFKDFILALGYKGEIIKEYFLNYYHHQSDLMINLKSGNIFATNNNVKDWTIQLIDTGLNVMTGGRLNRLRDKIQGDTFMLTYGDGVSNVNISQLVEFHASHGKIATVTAVRPTARFGGITMDGGKVVEFKEKPQTGEGWINGGFFVFNSEVFNYLHGDETVLEGDPLESLVKDGELMAYKHEGFWQCMDTLRDKQLLDKLWENGKAPWNLWE